jgi:hypothetical protein
LSSTDLIQSFSGQHTGENLRNQLEKIIAAFNIEGKVVRLVTDNASNNVKGFGDLVVPGFEVYFEPEEDIDEEQTDDESEYEEWAEDINMDDNDERFRMACFAHTLQLTVGDGLKECGCVKSAIFKVASIAKLR